MHTSFNHFLRENNIDNDTRSLLYHIARAVKYINFSIRAGNTGTLVNQNCYGEYQMELDLISDQIISKELEQSELAKIIVSEERDKEEEFPAPRGDFFVAYDPLDGSSLVDTNLAIGSIFGIWRKSNKIIGNKAGDDMVAAAYAVYGPRVTFVIAIKNKGVHEFELNEVGEFVLVRTKIIIKPETKYFAPGNLKVCIENNHYKSLINHWINNGQKLRYSGGMVPDLNHILSKKEGIFTYPSDKEHPFGKLRLLFECAPFALIFQEADGLATNELGEEILDLEVNNFQQKSSIFIGSKKEVMYALEKYKL